MIQAYIRFPAPAFTLAEGHPSGLGLFRFLSRFTIPDCQFERVGKVFSSA
jgi:hypothetical protein